MRSIHENNRAQHGDEVESEGTWAISYGDMVTLLLCFFILFFSIDPQKDKKERDESLQSGLIKVFANQKEKAAESQFIGGLKEAHVRAPASIDPTMITNLGAKAYKNDEKVLIEFPGVSFFKSGDLKITKEGSEALKRFASMYIPYAGQYAIGIRAFTDHRAVIQKRHRRFRDNLELSALRSVAAMRILQEGGIPLRLIRVGGYGELQETADALVTVRGLASKSDPKIIQEDLARKIVLVIEPGGKPNEK